MGFTALLNGDLIDAFAASNEELRAAREIGKNVPGSLVTPCCRQPAVVRVFRVATKRHNHFAHWPGAPRTAEECERWESKSKDHRDLQRLVYAAAMACGWTARLEQRVSTGSGYRIADVHLTAPWGQLFAIEVQLAPQSDPLYRARNLDYLNAGVTPVWLHLAAAEPPDPTYAIPRGAMRSLIEKKDEEDWFMVSRALGDDRGASPILRLRQQVPIGEQLIRLLAGHTTFGRSTGPRVSRQLPRALPTGRTPSRSVTPKWEPHVSAEPLFASPKSPTLLPAPMDDFYLPFRHIDIAAWRNDAVGTLITERLCACGCGRPIVEPIPAWYHLPKASGATHVLVNPHLAGGTVIGPCFAG